MMYAAFIPINHNINAADDSTRAVFEVAAIELDFM